MSDPVKAILRTIERRCTPFATTAVRHQHSAPWQSLLFNGARHRIGLSLHGKRTEEAVTAAHDAISAPDLAISGHLIIDLRIADVELGDQEALITLDVLTIEMPPPAGG